MKHIAPSQKIYTAKSTIPHADRGVFAWVSMKEGEVIEVCPFIEIHDPESSNLENNFLINYYYFFGETKERVLVALGFGSLYNHDYAPNAAYTIHPDEQTIVFSAIKNIRKNEEIKVNYNHGNDDCAPLWFEE